MSKVRFVELRENPLSAYWNMTCLLFPNDVGRCVRLTLKGKRHGGPKFGGPFDYIGTQFGLPNEDRTIERLLSGDIIRAQNSVLAPVWSNRMRGRHPEHLGFSYLDRQDFIERIFERLDERLPRYFEPLGQSGWSQYINPGRLRRSARTNSRFPDLSELVELVNEAAEVADSLSPKAHQNFSDTLQAIGMQASEREKSSAKKSLVQAYRDALSNSYVERPVIAIVSHDTNVREVLAGCVEALLGDQARIMRLAGPADAFQPGRARGQQARALLPERQQLWTETVNEARNQGVTHALVHTQRWFENKGGKIEHDMPANKPAAKAAFAAADILTQFIIVEPDERNAQGKLIGKICNGLGDLLFTQAGIIDRNVLTSAADEFETRPRVIAGITLVTQNARGQLAYSGAQYLSVVAHNIDQNETLARAYCIEDNDRSASLLPLRNALFKTSQLANVTLGRGEKQVFANARRFLLSALCGIATQDPHALVYIDATGLNRTWQGLRDGDISRGEPLTLPNGSLIQADPDLTQLRIVRLRPDHAPDAFRLNSNLTSGRTGQSIVKLGESDPATYLLIKRKPDTIKHPTTARTLGFASSDRLRRYYPLPRPLELFPAYGVNGEEETLALCRTTLLLMQNWLHYGGQTSLPSVLHLKKCFKEYAIVYAIQEIENEIDDYSEDKADL